MIGPLVVIALLVGFFAAMVALVEIGRRIGRARTVQGLSAVEGAVFGLMGLLIAFTFGSAAVKFETRRSYIVEEANNIGTAYLRLDLLPAETQPKLRDLFRRYVDTRLAVYGKLPDIDAATAELATMTTLQLEIWQGCVAATRDLPSPAPATLLLSALNDMIDITTTRTVAMQTHQPELVFVMLALMMLACSLLAGYGMAGDPTRSWLHIICFAMVLTLAFYTILDLEYPRFGLIKINWMDQVLRDVRATMGN